MRGYQPRLVDRLIGELLGELPALMLVGPRAAGKTTTAMRFAGSVIQLDREPEAAAFVADADAALRGLEEPVLLDEWQAVPQVLGAVKRAVDHDARSGRFLLTGSVRAELRAQTWPATGRVAQVAMFGLTIRELVGDTGASSPIDRLAEHGPGALRLPERLPDLRDYLELALLGAFPEPALRLAPPARARWLDGYLAQLLTRDATELADRRDPVLLRRYFEAVALNTAGAVADRKLYDAAGINSRTAAEYDRLLENLLIIDRTPAWFSNRLKRLTRTAKRYVMDPALATTSLSIDVDGVLRDGDLMGRILETFVMAQLRAEAGVSNERVRLHHLRVEKGLHEIDILVELSGGRVIGIEVKADGAPRADSSRHLRWLRDELGDRFHNGLVLHTGPRSFELDERIAAVPICALWG